MPIEPNFELPLGERRREYVRGMFGRIARRYDLMNSIMTAGLDAYWRRAAADLVQEVGPHRVLDVGTGTAQLAAAVSDRDPGVGVVGVDLTLPMLDIARLQGHRVALLCGDGLALPFGDRTFDAVTSAFTVRNFADPLAGLREQCRVLRPGGRLVCLELCMPASAVAARLFGLYFRHVVPLIGGAIAGDRSAYTYLPESVAHFAAPAAVAATIRTAGFIDVRWRRLHPGTVALYWAARPA